MRIEKQKQSLPVPNYDIVTAENTISKHGDLFPGGSKRGLLVGASGCGKTNVMIFLIEHPNGLRFQNLYLCSNSLQQSKYSYLRHMLKEVPEIGYFEFNDVENVPSPNNILKNSIIIFDDVACCKQDIIRNYFSFGRHNNTDTFYLCQTYSSIPKQLIRDNANLLIIFKQDHTNLKHIYDDHVNVDMSFSLFKNICSYCWRENFGLIVLDKDSPLNSGRYRKGFDSYIHI